MKILVITGQFPNKQEPIKGIFIKERVKEFNKFSDIKVVAPIPWYPSIKFPKRYHIYSEIERKERKNGVEVFHPRYFIIPKISRFLLYFLYFIAIFKQIKNIQKNFNFDIINAHFAYPEGFAAVLIAKILKKPIVVTLHGSDISLYLNYFLRRKMILYTLRNANKIIAVSNSLKKKVIEFGISKSKISVINNGIDVKRFKLNNKTKIRKLLNLPLNKKIILSVGYLIRRKGFHILIKAMSKIVKKNRTILLIIVGGSGGEMIYERKLKKLIKQCNLGNNVILLGQKPHKQIPLYMNAADIFCLASFREGFATVLSEAMACGKPIVATNVWGVLEAVKTDDYGILVPPGNPEKLASALTKALIKKWNIKKIMMWARGNSWKNIVKKEYTEFQRIVDGFEK